MKPHVVCRNCRYFLDARRPALQRCLHPRSRFVVCTSVEDLYEWRTPQQRNAKNDCRDFRPWRWWERFLMVDPALVCVGGLLGVVCVLTWWSFF